MSDNNWGPPLLHLPAAVVTEMAAGGLVPEGGRGMLVVASGSALYAFRVVLELTRTCLRFFVARWGRHGLKLGFRI